MASKDGSSFRLSAMPVTIFAHLLAIAIAVLVLEWNIHFRGGLSLSSENKQKIFNVHPVLMVIGFILAAGEAIMAYKIVPGNGRSKANAPKLVHFTLHLMALVVGIVGIYAVFKFHNELNIPNVYTLHSWLGISTISLYGLQLLLGFFSFLFPGTAGATRSKLLPWHWFFGLTIFLMSICTAETGLIEKFTFLNLQRQQEALIINFTGLLILLFAITVCLVVALPRTK